MLDLGATKLPLGDVTYVMGVINVSPDSKNLHTVARSVDEAMLMADRYRSWGATFIDLGGQSSHFDNPTIDSVDEISRVVPVVDALVAEGANQINGPNLTIDKPDEAYDEARVKAIAAGRARAELYARALGKRVVRLISVSESGGYVPPPMPMAQFARAEGAADASSKIDPGSQELQVSIAMSFELQ